jgi:hypothetical protein
MNLASVPAIGVDVEKVETLAATVGRGAGKLQLRMAGTGALGPDFFPQNCSNYFFVPPRGLKSLASNPR